MSNRPVIADPWRDFYEMQNQQIVVEAPNPGLPQQYYEHPGVMPQPGHPPNVHLVSKSEVDRQTRALLMEQGVIPIRSTGIRSVAVLDQAASPADIQYAFAKNLIGYILAENPDLAGPATPAGTAANPLAQAATGGPPVVGGCIALAELRFGHDGMNETVLFDLPPGAVVKVPFAGSSAKLLGRLVPKFYSHDDNNIVVGKRVYKITPTGGQITNAQFNLLPNVLGANAFTNSNPAPFSGFFAEGSVANGDQFSKPTRRFYGSVLTGAAALFQDTIVPVAWNAVAMQVTGGLSPLPGTPTGITLQFMQNGPVGSVSAGPYPLNTIVPLIDDCQSIEVFQNTAAAAGVEVPFEVIYYLSF